MEQLRPDLKTLRFSQDNNAKTKKY
jgi:hypothetical protein